MKVKVEIRIFDFSTRLTHGTEKIVIWPLSNFFNHKLVTETTVSESHTKVLFIRSIINNGSLTCCFQIGSKMDSFDVGNRIKEVGSQRGRMSKKVVMVKDSADGMFS